MLFAIAIAILSMFGPLTSTNQRTKKHKLGTVPPRQGDFGTASQECIQRKEPGNCRTRTNDFLE